MSKGLKIKPQGVRSNGSVFGDGIYFSDMTARSYLYSFEGIMILCEVALGDLMEVSLQTSFHFPLPLDKHSIKALGQYQPDQKITIENGLTISTGNIIADNNRKPLGLQRIHCL